jgi:agmatinase
VTDRPVLRPAVQEQLSGGTHEGLATFAKRPFVPDPDELDAWRPDAAFVGAPFDISTTHRPGARFGPRALRAQAYDPGTYSLDLGLDLWDWLTVVDHGDALCPHGQTERSHAAIRERVRGVASRGIVPLVVGGDHSITWPSATAVAESLPDGQRLGIVHFDAHADTADSLDGNLASHGTPMRRLIESGAVRGEAFVQIGLRGYWPGAETFAWMQEQGMRWHTMQSVWERGIRDVMAEAVEQALEHADRLYISVDIDVLDPGFAPGTGTPEPGGMAPADLLRVVRALAARADVAALDVVEVAPPYDHADLTVNNAHRVVLEFLSGMAARRRDDAGVEPGLPAR